MKFTKKLYMMEKIFNSILLYFKKGMLGFFFKVPKLALSPDFEVKIAVTSAELHDAFKLLHESYVHKGLMEPHSSGLRCNQYTFLPHTTTIIAKYKGQVVGTVAVIRDNPLGLPSDSDYLCENKELRKKFNHLMEVSALSVDKKFRAENHAVTILLIKYIANYAKTFTKSNCLVCTVHPKAAFFYAKLCLFKQQGQVVKYKYVNGALACLLFVDIGDSEYFKKVAKSFPFKSPLRNMSSFTTQADPRFKYPKQNTGQIVYPIMTIDILYEFFVRKTQILTTLNQEHKRFFLEIYRSFYGNEAMKKFDNLNPENQAIREFRVPLQIESVLFDELLQYPSIILDVSSRGCFITCNNVRFKPGDQLRLRFEIQNSTYLLRGKIKWVNENLHNFYPYGYGFVFNKDQPELYKIILKHIGQPGDIATDEAEVMGFINSKRPKIE